MAAEPVIEVENLTKYYGNFPAISDVSFTVDKGEILGFLGPNGAGKSTTMKILTGYMPPTEGVVRIAGYDVVSQSLEARKRMGYLPETVPLYTDMTVRGYLGFMGSIRGMSRDGIRRRTGDVVDICRLGDYTDTLIGKLSKGFRQRVGIAQAILHEPDILILDEPTIGIDPIQVVETRQLIKDLGTEHTVVISTHILPEVSAICQRVVIIHEGEIVAMDSPENLAERLQASAQVVVDVRGPKEKVTAALKGIDGVQGVTVTPLERGTATYTVTSGRDQDIREEVARQVVQQGWGLLRQESLSMSLEEIFLRLTTEEPSS
ncbi:MAG: ABC transporter ATP-binding protein [Chloroflexi bacterium]|nr:ABC transporter ATP-binding protein [Chloroflexota bacterium]